MKFCDRCPAELVAGKNWSLYNARTRHYRCRKCTSAQKKVYDFEHYLETLWRNISKHTVNGIYAEAGRKNRNNLVYFDAGTRIHPAWRNNQQVFVRWVRENLGERTRDADGVWKSLDRIDNDGHYSPGNLRWASALEQSANQGRISDMTDVGFVEGYLNGPQPN